MFRTYPRQGSRTVRGKPGVRSPRPGHCSHRWRHHSQSFESIHGSFQGNQSRQNRKKIHSSNLQYSATASPVHAVVNQTEDWTPFDSRPETHTERLGKGTQNEQLNGPRLAAQGLLRPAQTRRFSVSKNWRRSVKQVWLNQLANHLNEFRWLAGNFAKGPHRNNTVKALTPACFQELGF